MTHGGYTAAGSGCCGTVAVSSERPTGQAIPAYPADEGSPRLDRRGVLQALAGLRVGMAALPLNMPVTVAAEVAIST